mmetsp:Transcript_3947/g.5428  ORF Transcript_3947/g.5428 Transcript_3947/m.5428 type:complete len:93 (+) Transcript_3947:776-1054(+)
MKHVMCSLAGQESYRRLAIIIAMVATNVTKPPIKQNVDGDCIVVAVDIMVGLIVGVRPVGLGDAVGIIPVGEKEGTSVGEVQLLSEQSPKKA